MEWLRYYTATLQSRKIQDLPLALFKAWVNLLCVARTHDGVLPDTKEISFQLRCSLKQAENFVSELHARRLLDWNEDSKSFIPHDWDEHQYRSDNVYERVKKHREKRKGNVSGNVSGNGNETPRARDRTEQIQIQSRTEQKARAPVVADLNGQTSQRFEEFWNRWPRKQHKDAACQMWISCVCVSDEKAVFDCLGRFLGSEQASRGVVPNPENWLLEQSRDRWQGDWPKANGNGSSPRKLSVTEQAKETWLKMEAQKRARD